MTNHITRMTMSFAKGGRGDIRHNNREFIPHNVDRSRIKDNVILVKEDIKKCYDDIFGEAVEKYNQKQTRGDRKIQNYYDKVYRSKRITPYVEFIIQVGNANEKPDDKTAEMIYRDFLKEIQEKYPNMHVFNAVIHNDEMTPHMHIDMIPVAEKYKKGLEKRVSFDKCLKENGFPKFDNFRDEMIDQLVQCSGKHHISYRQARLNDTKHIPIQEYRALQQQAEKKIKEISKTTGQDESNPLYRKMNVVSKDRYDNLMRENEYYKAQNKAFSEETDSLRTKVSMLKQRHGREVYDSLHEEINRLTRENMQFEDKIDDLNQKHDEEISMMKDSNSRLEKQNKEYGSALLTLQRYSDEIKPLRAKNAELEKENRALKATNRQLEKYREISKNAEKTVQELHDTRAENTELKQSLDDKQKKIESMTKKQNLYSRAFKQIRTYRARNDTARMNRLLHLVANEQEAELEEALDEFYHQKKHTRMVQ